MPGRLAALIALPRLRRNVVVFGLLGLAAWFLFLDSHSLLKRMQYASERKVLREEVEILRQVNGELEARLAAGLTDEIVEKVAREQYGMRRAGETVYPLEHLND